MPNWFIFGFLFDVCWRRGCHSTSKNGNSFGIWCMQFDLLESATNDVHPGQRIVLFLLLAGHDERVHFLFVGFGFSVRVTCPSPTTVVIIATISNYVRQEKGGWRVAGLEALHALFGTTCSKRCDASPTALYHIFAWSDLAPEARTFTCFCLWQSKLWNNWCSILLHFRWNMTHSTTFLL